MMRPAQGWLEDAEGRGFTSESASSLVLATLYQISLERAEGL
jgi:hypothetical protein